MDATLLKWLTFNPLWVGGDPDNHEYVDLGLPSGTLWATCNIGANSPEEAGLYFAWGETQGYTAEQVGSEEGKRAFDWDNYKFGPDSAITKYNDTDGLTVLEPEDDAATVNWGEGWRMPTKEQFWELMRLPHKWDSLRSGYSFTDANDNELLFLFAGARAYYSYTPIPGKFGYYWTNSLSNYYPDYPDYFCGAYIIYFNSGTCISDIFVRHVGNTVRPVRSKNI